MNLPPFKTSLNQTGISQQFNAPTDVRYVKRMVWLFIY